MEKNEDFKKYNAHFNWHYNKFIPYSEVVLIVDTMEENSKQTLQPLVKLYILKHYLNEVISKLLARMYFHILLEQYDKSEELIQEITLKIEQTEQKKFIGWQNKDGFLYVLKGLETFLCFKKNENPELLDQLLIEMRNMNITTFDEFSPKTKVGILAAKFYFLSFFESFNKEIIKGEQLAILNDLQKLDPENGEWFYLMYRFLRDERREKDKNKPPSNQETAEIDGDLKLPAEDYYWRYRPNRRPLIQNRHPFVQICRFIYFADLIRTNHTFQRIEVEPDTFVHDNIAVRFLSVETRKLLKEFENDFFANFETANIFMSYLPKKYRFEDELIKNCLEKCLALGLYPNSNSTNSEVYRKYGIVHLNLDYNYRNIKKAEECFLQALKYNPQNFSALKGLIQTKMGFAVYNKNALEILEIFEKELPNFEANPGQKANLLYIKGIFLFIRKKDLEAVDCWNEVFKLDKKVLEKFTKLSDSTLKYSWEKERLNYVVILYVISRLFKKYPGVYDELQDEIKRVKREHEDKIYGNSSHSQVSNSSNTSQSEDDNEDDFDFIRKEKERGRGHGQIIGTYMIRRWKNRDSFYSAF